MTKPARTRFGRKRLVIRVSSFEFDSSFEFRHSSLRSIALLLLLTIFAPALADPPREITIATVPEAEQPFVIKHVVPGANCMAVSDVAGLLAVGMKYGSPAEVWVYKLDAVGAIAAGDPMKIPLPKPAALAGHANAAATLAFHPKLPILYIWQDMNVPGDVGDPAANPVFKELDHLLVVNFASGAPVVAATTCRGPEYHYNRNDGELVFNADATKMFPPGLRMPVPTANTNPPAVGFLELDAAGMPVMAEGKPKLTLEDVSVILGYPNVYGFVPVTDDVWIFPGAYGPATLDRSNRRGRITSMTYPGNAYWWYHTGHPSLPVIYTTYVNTAQAFRIEHAGGFITGPPQRINIPGGALTSPPVVLTKQKKVAWGGGNRVVLVTIDDAGYYTATATQVPAKNPSVAALAYSEKLDKLYVAVEAQ
jgi:hypothetical protein